MWSLGIPGLVQGPGSYVQETLRRVVITVPPFAVNVDQAQHLYDTIHIAPGTISNLRFRLVGKDGKVVKLQGQNWSCSLMCSLAVVASRCCLPNEDEGERLPAAV